MQGIVGLWMLHSQILLLVNADDVSGRKAPGIVLNGRGAVLDHVIKGVLSGQLRHMGQVDHGVNAWEEGNIGRGRIGY